MESTGDEGAADRAAMIARLVADIRNARAAGKSVDDELIISAHPELMPDLRQELLKLSNPRSARTTSRTGQSISLPADPGATRLPGSDVPTGANMPSVEVPGYNILKELGRGGQAVVFLANQLSTGRKVAVKVTYEGPLADERSQARFNREVRALAALQHPNIVAILDTGRTADGNRYIAMDFIAGWSLDEYMKYRHKKDPTDPSKLLRMFLKLCAAMNVAHSQGILHRDLKPSNIRVDERGEPHILDFGLARSAMDRFITGSDQPVSITGEFLGSIPWSSPEQAEGNPDKIDVRTDVYSLGVILYQMITGGRFPYEVVGNIRDVLNNILTAAPTPPSKAVRSFLAKQPRAQEPLPIHGPSDVNEALEKVVLKALAKKPEKRYQTAGELGRDIANYLAGERTTAREAANNRDGDNSSKQKKRRLLATAIAGAILLAGAAGFGGWRYWRTKSPAISEAPAPVIQLTPTPTPAVPASVLSIPAPLPTAKTSTTIDTSPPMMLRGKCRLIGQDLCLTPVGLAEGIFLIGNLKWSDYDLTFRAMSNSEGGFNVIFHWTDPGTYYAFCPGSPNNRFSDLFKRVEKGLPQRANGQLRFGRLEPDRWYEIHLEVRGSSYRCFVDGKQWLQTLDPAFTHGKVGFGVWNSSPRFRDIKVTAPGGSLLWSGPPDLSNLPRFAIDRSNLLVPPLPRIDLLAQSDAVRDTLAGTWTQNKDSLTSTAGANAQIEFPYTPIGDYDYRVEFSRTAGDSPISPIFPIDAQMCDWTISAAKPAISGFATVDGQGFDNNRTTNHYNREILENGERHTLTVTLRSHLVTAYIDGSQCGVLRTEESRVTLDRAIVPPHENHLGLRIGGDEVIIHSADLLPVAGATTRPAAAGHESPTEPAKN